MGKLAEEQARKRRENSTFVIIFVSAFFSRIAVHM